MHGSRGVGSPLQRNRTQLVNDSSYSGEAGVSVTIERGTLVRARLTDVRALRERLGAAVNPEMADLDRYLSPEVAG